MKKLISMQMTKKEREKQYEPAVASSDNAPVYPWGLALNLDSATLDKLGIESLPEVGSKLTLVAEVSVTGANENKTTGGTSRSINLQITKMCLGEGGDGKKAEEVLYDGAKG